MDMVCIVVVVARSLRKRLSSLICGANQHQSNEWHRLETLIATDFVSIFPFSRYEKEQNGDTGRQEKMRKSDIVILLYCYQFY